MNLSVEADDPVRPNTAQRCHSEPVRRLAWESVPLASLFGGALFFVKTRRSTEGILCVCRSAAATYRRKSPAAYTPSPSNAGVYASSAEVRSCTNPSVMPQFRI